jgi:hypothetical protein
MKDEKLLLLALFLSSALADTLDDITNQNYFVMDFKKNTKRYMNFLKKKTFKLLDNSYELDPEVFELLDNAISNTAKETAEKMFEDLFLIDQKKNEND